MTAGRRRKEQQTVPEGRPGQAKNFRILEDTMKALIKGLMTIAMIAATAACDGSPTASSSAFTPESDGIAMAKASNFTFNNTASYTTANPQTATGGTGFIDFSGTLMTGTPCYNVTGARSVSGTNVTVTVTANDNGNICQQVITNQNYTGRVSALAAGTYNFTVVHVTNGTSATAYSSTVTVQ
jgi:ABC-type oligopeptide transport system substrate-binding subunit